MGANLSIGQTFGCPVCLDMFKENIVVCSAGHSVCEVCRRSLQECPLCKAHYTGTRNYNLEQILTKLKEVNCTPEEAIRRIVEGQPVPENTMPNIYSMDSNNVIDLRLRPKNHTEKYTGSFFKLYSRGTLTYCFFKQCKGQLLPSNTTMKDHLNTHSNDIKTLEPDETSGRNYFDFGIKCETYEYFLCTKLEQFCLIIDFAKEHPPNDYGKAIAWIKADERTCFMNRREPALSYVIEIEMNGVRVVAYQDYVNECKEFTSELRRKYKDLSVRVKCSSSLKVKGYITQNV